MKTMTKHRSELQPVTLRAHHIAFVGGIGSPSLPCESGEPYADDPTVRCYTGNKGNKAAENADDRKYDRKEIKGQNRTTNHHVGLHHRSSSKVPKTV
jgi:hypothetical protein